MNIVFAQIYVWQRSVVTRGSVGMGWVLLLAMLATIPNTKLLAGDHDTSRNQPHYRSSKTIADIRKDPSRQVLPADTIITRDLKELVISAQRVPVHYSDVRRSIQVLDRQYIRGSASHDLAGLLSEVRGFDIRHRGTFGMQSDVSIRGGTFDQTLVLLNGVNVTDPQTGHHNLNLPVDLQSIERIEVLRGPGARIFGPNAFNGAVNIITKEPGEPRFSARLTGGQHRFGSAGIATGFATGPLEHHLSVSGMTSDGFTENTDFSTGNLFYRTRYSLSPGYFDLQAGYNEKAFGANSFYSPAFPDQFEHTRTGFASLRWLPEGSLRLSPTIYWRRHHDRFELFRDEAPDWYSGHNYHRTDILGASLNWMHTNRMGTSSVGLDYRYEHIYSNVLGDVMQEPRRVSGYDDAWFTHSYERSGLSIMLEQSYSRGPFSLSGGTLIYTNTDLDQSFTLFPGIDAGWQFHDNLRWYATANRTLRLPTFTDLFYSGPDNLGNPDLKPEEAISLETGFNSRWRDVQVHAAFFRRWGTNMIDWIRGPGDELWRSENLTEVTISGIETGVTLPLRIFSRKSRSSGQSSRNSGPGRNSGLESNSGSAQSSGSISGHRSGTNTLSVHYTFLHSGKESGDFISNYALDHLNHKLDLILRLSPFDWVGGQLTATWQDRAGSYMVFKEGAFTDTRPFEPFWMINLKLYYQIGTVRLIGEASNVLDTHYHDIANVPQPGRWIRAGLEISL